jgi:predicted esterase
MKNLISTFCAAALCLTVTLLVPGHLKAQKRTLTAHASTTIDAVIGGFYTSLPASYSTSTKSYPLLIFIHGIGEEGNGSASALPLVLRNGPPMQINQQVNYGTNANFPDPVVVNGQSFEFIVVCPQFNQWPNWAGEVQSINDMIDYCEKNYRVDASKIYCTGLSMGGGITWDYAGGATTNRIAGVVVVAGASNPSAGAVSQIIKEHLPVWATHNLNDPTVPESATVAWVNQINSGGANPQALETIFNASGHGGWIPTYGAVGTPGITNSKGQNVYQWMLSYKRSGDNVVIDNGSTTTAQAAPTVSAGSNQTLTLAAATATAAAATSTSTTLNGSASTTGSIASYQWSQVSGPNTATFGNAKAASSSVSGLAQGTYVFKLTATDNVGQTASAQVTITVNPAPVTTVFTVNAGPDVTITLPTNSVKLTGVATVQGSVTLKSCIWKQLSGPNTSTISNSGTITPTISGVVAGSYVFQVTITASSGATTSDQMTLKVNPAPVANVFKVSAGPDVSITLPTNSVKITGVATVQGSEAVASSKWKQVSGPNASVISNSGTIAPTVSNLVAGTYVLEVDMTSTAGQTVSDQMTLTVNAAAVATVFTANAGPDVFLTLPTNSWKIIGTCTVKGVSVATCKWKQVSGPGAAIISGSGSITPVVSNLIAGTYVFEVDVTSTTGLTTSDQMSLKVNPATTAYSGTTTAPNGATIATTSAADLKLYPNPATAGQQVVVEGQGVKAGTVKAVIYDVSGKQAKQQVVENATDNYFHQAISTDGLTRGMYVLSLASGSEKPQLFKFVVQ